MGFNPEINWAPRDHIRILTNTEVQDKYHKMKNAKYKPAQIKRKDDGRGISDSNN